MTGNLLQQNEVPEAHAAPRERVSPCEVPGRNANPIRVRWNSMTLRSAIVAVAMVASTLFAGAAIAAEPVSFRYKAVAGNQQVWKIQRTLKQEQTEGASRLKTAMDEKSELLITFQPPLENGEMPFRFTTRAILARWQIGSEGEFQFDSTNVSATPTNTVLASALLPVYTRILGTELGGAISPTGRLLRVEGYADLVRDLVAGNMLTRELTSGGTDESHRQNLATGWIVFKDEPVSPGDSWETPVEVSLPGSKMAGGTRTIKFVGMEQREGKELAHFTIQTNITFDIRTETNGYVVTGQLAASESNGDLYFDAAIGRPVSVSLKTRMQGVINVANPIGQTRSVVIDQTSEFAANVSDEASPASAAATTTSSPADAAKDAAATPTDGSAAAPPSEKSAENGAEKPVNPENASANSGTAPNENGSVPPKTDETPPANPNP